VAGAPWRPGTRAGAYIIISGGFWNLAATTPSATPIEPPAQRAETSSALPEIPQVPPQPPTFHPHDLDPREYRFMSMNALTNAVNFIAAFKDLLKPVNVDEALAMVDYYRSLMIDLHHPDHAGTGDPQSRH
jgi:hypothetical protein